MLVVSDTSPIANLIQIGRFDILESLNIDIFVPPAVHQEILALESFSIDISAYLNSNQIRLKEPINKQEVRTLQIKLDKGESEAIILAKELNISMLIIDERLGTKIAKEYGLNTVGLLGILIKAKQKGIIANLMPLIDDLENVAGFWIGDKLKNSIKKIVQE